LHNPFTNFKQAYDSEDIYLQHFLVSFVILYAYTSYTYDLFNDAYNK